MVRSVVSQKSDPDTWQPTDRNQIISTTLIRNLGSAYRVNGEDCGWRCCLTWAYDAGMRPQLCRVSKIGSVARMTKLTQEQFQFARALYVAIPPISRRLPPGDRAVIASANGRSMVAIVSGTEACARFLAPDFLLSMLSQVGKGETEAAGAPI